MTTPQFDKISGVTPKSVVDVIACELIETRDKICLSIRKHGRLGPARDRDQPCDDPRNEFRKVTHDRTPKGKPLPNLAEWTAAAELTLTVDEQATLAPAFTHTDVVSKSFTRAFDWGVKFSTEAQRTYTESITFDIKNMKKKDGKCDAPPTRILLNGNLGLEEVVEMAFGSIDPHDAGTGFPGEAESKSPMRGRGGVPSGAGNSQTQGKALYLKRDGSRAQRDGRGRGPQREGAGKKEGAFGTSIEFVVTRALNATGPTWTLAYFKGPGKLFTGESQNTHKLRISFSKGNPGEHRNPEQDAQASNFKLLFESLGPKLRQAQ